MLAFATWAIIISFADMMQVEQKETHSGPWTLQGLAHALDMHWTYCACTGHMHHIAKSTKKLPPEATPQPNSICSPLCSAPE